ncbi:MAG: dihydrodipicolinate synthase family protein [Desulfocucumaceae bacterium]
MQVRELKKWAKENMKGVENLTIPSFTPDLSGLDEEGIRWDVRQSIKHGFFSTCCAAELGLTLDEAKRFVEIVADEARGKILVSTTLFFNSMDQNIEMANHAEKVGCHAALLGFPLNYNPSLAEEAFKDIEMVCNETSLAMVLYPTHKSSFEKFHPSGYPLDLLGRLVEIENVVAVKIGSGDPAFIYEIFERCGDKALVNCNIVDWAPIMVPKYGQQWIGAAVFEVYQSPEKPYLVDFFNLLLKGDQVGAMETYWKMKPLSAMFESNIMLIMQGAYPWNLFKYYQWCVGGNGGFTRHPMRIFAHQMMAARFSYMSAGIMPRENIDEFYVGRVNYSGMNKA